MVKMRRSCMGQGVRAELEKEEGQFGQRSESRAIKLGPVT